jgi:protein subunit release factor B
MKFGNFGIVNPRKICELKTRIQKLGLDLNLIEESFSAGGGKGGQKINKTANKVLLKYKPLNLTVTCQKERSRALNRFLALRKLVDTAELKISPETNKLAAEINRIRKRKAKKMQKYKRKNMPQG